MMVRIFVLATAMVLSATAIGRAQSQTGANFGTPYSGSAASRSNGGGSYTHSHHRDTGGQSARDSGASGGGREIDARDSEGAGPVARQASTPK
jgi:hypothetical protein